MCGQVRIFCSTSAHLRTVHFKMSNDAIRRTLFDGYRENPNFATEHTLLTGGESAYLPGQTDRTYNHGGSHDGFTGEPFYKLHNYHFNTRFTWHPLAMSSEAGVNDTLSKCLPLGVRRLGE